MDVLLAHTRGARPEKLHKRFDDTLQVCDHNLVWRLYVMKKVWLYALTVFATFSVPNLASASSIVVSLGNTNPVDLSNAPLVSGTAYGSGVISPNFVAPFSSFCGSEGGATPSDCDTSWTFTYTVPLGETITNATLSLGIWDIDSSQAGNQIGLFQVNGGDNLTTTFNTAAEALNGGTGSVNAEYDVFTFALSNFGALSGGSATVHLTLIGPGGGILGPLPNNAGAILFSTLNITTQGSAPPPTVPEPSTMLLLATGLCLGGRSRLARILGRR